MLKDIGFSVALLGSTASAVGAVILLWNGHWLEGLACGFAFAACILIGFWLAMSAMLDHLDKP